MFYPKGDKLEEENVTVNKNPSLLQMIIFFLIDYILKILK